MKRETPYTDERLTRAGLVGYLRYMKRRGLADARESLWVQKVAAFSKVSRSSVTH